MLGAGSVPEEVFGICRRKDCPTVKMLRRRALKSFLKRGVALASPSAYAAAAGEVIRKIGYAAEDAAAVKNAVLREYAELLRLDAALGEDAVALLGGRPGMPLEELLYASGDRLVGALHEAAMALFMEYLDRPDWRQLDVLDFAAYAALELLRRMRITRERAAELLKWITDQALSEALTQ
jgi:hypothetical protein